jgi:uncharacterized protein (DUF1810 family)
MMCGTIKGAVNLTGEGLQRFVEAQDPVYGLVRDELAEGRKRSHWMWFVFPQLSGLGHSRTARMYGIAARHEAMAYCQHPVLGPRLRECTAFVLATRGQSAHDIFGTPDDLKFHSCMTLFAAVAPHEPLFSQALARFFAGRPDARTLALLDDGDSGTLRSGPVP